MLVLALVVGVSSHLSAQENYGNYNNNQANNSQSSNAAKKSTNSKASKAKSNYENYNYNNADYENAEFNPSTEANAGEEEYGDSTDDVASLDVDGTDDLPHPPTASRWRTREMLLTSSLPPAEEMGACRDELKGLADNAINAETMLTSRNLLTQSIVSKTELYHWCFYYSAWLLENKLDQFDLTKTFQEKYSFFISEMKLMWIFARGLDAALDSKKYFGYIRRRYLEISAVHFGRPLEVLSTPLGDKGRAVPLLDPKAVSPLFQDY